MKFPVAVSTQLSTEVSPELPTNTQDMAFDSGQDISLPSNSDCAKKLLLRRQSSEDEGLEIKFCDENELELVKTVEISRNRRPRTPYLNCANLLYDDSGFNSSDNEDAEEENTPPVSLPASDTSNLSVKLNPQWENISSDCDTDESSLNLSTNIKSNVSIPPPENLPSRGGEVFVDRTISAETSTSQHASFSQGRQRLVRRHRSIDSNNNDTADTSLHSYLLKAPFKLNECFKDRGFFCLVTCIIYTLFLVFVLGAAGLLMDSLKYAISKDDVKELRSSFFSSRQRRAGASSG